MSGKTQKAVLVTKWGKYPEDPAPGLEVTDGWTVAEPGEGQVLVRMSLRPVNPADIFSICGFYPGFTPPSLPAVPGLEGVGRVEKNGTAASKFKVGQRVVGAPFPAKSGDGTWKQFIVVDEKNLVAVPDEVDEETAAQFLVNPVTAYGFLEELQVPRGDWLLQNAATSVLGRQVIELAKHKGIKTINLVRRKEAVEELKKLGADEVVVSTEEDVVARVKEITGGKGAFSSLDPIGGDITTKIIKATRDHGDVVIYSAMAAMEFETPIPDILFRLVTIRGFWLNVFLQKIGDKRRLEILNEVMDLLAKRIISPMSGPHYPLDEAKDAVMASIEPGHGGKILLEG